MTILKLIFCGLCFFSSSLLAQSQPNILFISIDDLRTELGCYGVSEVKSPSIDALAKDAMVFERAYCQEAICGPSRASVMTGTRPDTNGVTQNSVHFRDTFPQAITLPEFFISKGYQAVNVGKIYHQGKPDNEKSWNTQPLYKSFKVKRKKGSYVIAEHNKIQSNLRAEMKEKYGEAVYRSLSFEPVLEAGPIDDHGYIDGYNTSLAIHTLKEINKSDKPWFMGLGYKRPHLPFTAPKKYFDLYDPEKLSVPKNRTPPTDGAMMGLHASFETRVRHGVPKSGEFDAAYHRKLKHAYYACVSYVDAQIGRVIQSLKDMGEYNNTLIVIWSDHGFHLGEYGIWGKATNYEVTTKVPLIIRSPLMKAKGQSTSALVELVDIYPTLLDLCGHKGPSYLEGKSLAPLLDQPNLPWKKGIFSQFPTPALREWAASPLSHGMRETYFGPLIRDVESKIKAQVGSKWDRQLFENDLMGYAYRSDCYRLVSWQDTTQPQSPPPLYRTIRPPK